MKIKLYHTSKRPLETVHSCPDQIVSHKPMGLWVSVGSAWEDWCTSEMPHWVMPHKAEVVLTNKANLLLINSIKKLDAFTNAYRVDTFNTRALDSFHIDWPKVATQYQGIIIAPYQWQRRLDGKCSWYYTWDCASGCIWDADAIKEIKNVGKPGNADRSPEGTNQTT